MIFSNQKTLAKGSLCWKMQHLVAITVGEKSFYQCMLRTSFSQNNLTFKQGWKVGNICYQSLQICKTIHNSQEGIRSVIFEKVNQLCQNRSFILGENNKFCGEFFFCLIRIEKLFYVNVSKIFLMHIICHFHKFIV